MPLRLRPDPRVHRVIEQLANCSRCQNPDLCQNSSHSDFTNHQSADQSFDVVIAQQHEQRGSLSNYTSLNLTWDARDRRSRDLVDGPIVITLWRTLTAVVLISTSWIAKITLLERCCWAISNFKFELRTPFSLQSVFIISWLLWLLRVDVSMSTGFLFWLLSSIIVCYHIPVYISYPT